MYPSRLRLARTDLLDRDKLSCSSFASTSGITEHESVVGITFLGVNFDS